MLTADAKAPGGIEGSGGTLVVEHTTDNNADGASASSNSDVKMLAAEDDFDAQRPQAARRRVHHPERRPRAAGAVDQRPRALRVGRGVGAIGEDARDEAPAHRLRAFLVAHAG